jgi:hypothetical protein
VAGASGLLELILDRVDFGYYLPQAFSRARGRY